MKFVYAFAFLALIFVASVRAVCDPDSDGKPSCSDANEGDISRNFWDPTRYWECKGGVATSVSCPSQTGFLTSAKSCVPWSEWKWVAPCPS